MSKRILLSLTFTFTFNPRIFFWIELVGLKEEEEEEEENSPTMGLII